MNTRVIIIYATKNMSPPELRQRLGWRFSQLVHPYTSLMLVLMLMPVLMSALVLVLMLMLVLVLV